MIRKARDEREKMIYWKSLGIGFFVLLALTLFSLFFYQPFFSDYLYCYTNVMAIAVIVVILYQGVNGAYFIEGRPVVQLFFVWLMVGLWFLNFWTNFTNAGFTGVGAKPLDRYSMLGFFIFAVVQAMVTTYFVARSSGRQRI